MRRIFTLSLLSAILFALPLSAQKREHRAVWMSAYTGCWPSGKLTANNAERQKEICRMDLDSLQRSNFTTIYYHARVMCDATYDSKYEPWSSYVSTARGVEPAFDPFGFLVEEAHARGLEVYAWLNPYRYLDSSYQEDWGSAGGDKNYENSHPEWLIKWKNGSHTWTILNPALPEVKQRIVDVIADIMDKYDVDGIVFDDYFYQSSLPEEYDAEWYNAYVAEAEAAEETPMSQLDWRRENVNDMVRKVNAYIKSTKPWVRFGIGPAGIACTDESIAEKYGILPSPGHDNQYNSIASEPVAWLHEGSIDFISPQIYWLDSYATLAPWWYETAGKFNRHCYTSQTLSSFSSAASMNVYVNQIDLTRANDILEAPGYVFFQWRLLKSSSKRIERKDVKLLHWLRENAYHDHALPPAVTWLKADCPGVVSNLKRDGRTLSWSGPENVRYTVYAVPADVPMEDFRKEAEYLRGISYDRELVEKIWKEVLLYQFHDLLPGSCIKRVYDESRERYKEIYKQLQAVAAKLIDDMSGGESETYVAINPVDFARKEYIRVEDKWYTVDLAPMSTGTPVPVENADISSLTFGENSISNGLITITFGKGGEITSLMDVANGKELVAEGQYLNKLTQTAKSLWRKVNI